MRLWLFSLYLVVISQWLPGQEGATLLIETEPFGASVVLAGEEPMNTPVLIRDLPPGSLTATIRKDGFAAEERTVVLEAGEVSVLSVPLEPREYLVAFPENKTVAIGQERSVAPYQRIPEGTVTIHPDEGTIYLRPVYPRQDLLDGARIATPVVAALTAIIAAFEWASPREPVPRLSPAVTTGFLTTLGLMGLTASLHLQRERYIDTYGFSEEERTSLDADRLMLEIDEAIGRGELLTAQEKAAAFLRLFPEDPRVAEVLYIRGQVYLISGETDAAYRALRLLIEAYPTRAYHDRAVTLLAGIEEERGNREVAASLRRRILFPD